MQKYIIKKKINKNYISNLTLKIQLHLISKDSKHNQIKYYKKLKKYKYKTQNKHQLKI